MKLATLRGDGPDGRLVVVSPDLRMAVPAGPIAPTLQAALDNWRECAPQLTQFAVALESGTAENALPFDPASALAPLPRAWQWLDASAFPSHGVRMQKAFSQPPIPTIPPLMYQGLSHRFLSGKEDVPFPNEADGIDFEGEFGVITDAVPMGTTAAAALSHIRLVVQINDWSLRTIAPREMKTGFGWIRAKPACSMAPIALTPDELGPAWCDGRIRARLRVWRNGEPYGDVPADEMAFGFHELIAHAAYSRDLCAGTVIGSGTISSSDVKSGVCCITEKRANEIIERGSPNTEFMRFGERIRMDAHDDAAGSLFGALDQAIVALHV